MNHPSRTARTLTAPTRTTRTLTALTTVALTLIAAQASAEYYPYHPQGGAQSGNWLSTGAPVDQLRFGDFDGDGQTDVFWRRDDHKWYISYSRPTSISTGSWQHVNTSSAPLADLAVGDFNGDGADDIFYATGAGWKYSPSATGGWVNLAGSVTRVDELLLGDFNGDKKTDVFYPDGTHFYISYGGASSWTLYQTSWYTRDMLRVGDFNGDKKDDLFVAVDSAWHMRNSHTNSWSRLRDSTTGVGDLVFGDFDGVAGTDILITNGQDWSVCSGGSGAPRLVNPSSIARAHHMIAVHANDSGVADIVVMPVAAPSVGGEALVSPDPNGDEPMEIASDGTSVTILGDVSLPGPFGDIILGSAYLTYDLDADGELLSMSGTAEVAPNSLGFGGLVESETLQVSVGWLPGHALADLAPVYGDEMYSYITFTTGLSVTVGSLNFSSPDATTTTVLFNPNTFYVSGAGLEAGNLTVDSLGVSNHNSFPYSPAVAWSTQHPEVESFVGQFRTSGSYAVSNPGLSVNADDVVLGFDADATTLGLNGTGSLGYDSPGGAMALSFGAMSARLDINSDGTRLQFAGTLDSDETLAFANANPNRLKDIVDFNGHIQIHGQMDTRDRNANALYISAELSVKNLTLGQAYVSVDSGGVWVRGVARVPGFNSLVGVKVRIYDSGAVDCYFIGLTTGNVLKSFWTGAQDVATNLASAIDNGIQDARATLANTSDDVTALTAELADTVVDSTVIATEFLVSTWDSLAPQGGAVDSRTLAAPYGFVDIRAFGAGHTALDWHDSIKDFCQSKGYDDGIETDLNAGIREVQYIYYCVKYASQWSPLAVTDFEVSSWANNPYTTFDFLDPFAPLRSYTWQACKEWNQPSEEFVHPGLQRLDLNSQASGRYLYSCLGYDTFGARITRLRVVSHSDYSTAMSRCTADGFSVVRRDGGASADLNEGTGSSSSYVFACIRK